MRQPFSCICGFWTYYQIIPYVFLHSHPHNQYMKNHQRKSQRVKKVILVSQSLHKRLACEIINQYHYGEKLCCCIFIAWYEVGSRAIQSDVKVLHIQLLFGKRQLNAILQCVSRILVVPYRQNFVSAKFYGNTRRTSRTNLCCFYFCGMLYTRSSYTSQQMII